MKRKMFFLIALTLLLTSISGFVMPELESVAAAPALQKVSAGNAVVTASALNVRQGPGTNYKIVCTLKKGQNVKLLGKIGNWYAVYDTATGCVGCADGRYLKIGGTTGSQAPKPTPKQQAQQKPQQKEPMPSTPKTTTPDTPKITTPKTPAEGISEEEQKVLDLVNAERTKAGLEPLQIDMELQKVARLKAQDMSENNYFAHNSPTYGSPFDMMRQFNISFKAAGENLAGNSTAEGAVKAWMNSEGHRENILNPKFNYTGIGIAPSATYTKIYVQMFIQK
jgi:uncharacterized YkwD family protein